MQPGYPYAYTDFTDDNWTPGQWARAMKAAYEEQLQRGVPAPRVTYTEAYKYHLRMVGKLGMARP